MLSLVACAALDARAHAQAAQTPSAAESSASYDQLIDAALAAFDARDYPRARALFEQAHARRPSARTLRGLGFAALELKDYTRSRAELTAALADARQPLSASQRQEVSQLLSWIAIELATLSVTLVPATAVLTLNGARVRERELVLEQGEYQVRAEAAGHRPTAARVTLERGAHERLSLRLLPLEPAASTATSTGASDDAQRASLPIATTALPADQAPAATTSVLERWWFWTIVGVVVAGGVATGLALSHETSPKPYRSDGVGGVVFAVKVSR